MRAMNQTSPNENPGALRACLACQTADPPPSMMCLRAATTTSALPSAVRPADGGPPACPGQPC